MNNMDVANNTSHYQNDTDFDFSSNSGVFNQMNQDGENYADSNVNTNFNV